MQTINELQYEDMMKSGGTAVIEFGAAWCPPCRALLPILDELAEEYGKSVKIASVDVDNSPALASVFGVMSMPTVILFKNGEPVDKLVGLRSKAAYKAVIDRTVG